MGNNDCEVLINNHEKLIGLFYRFKMSIGCSHETTYDLFYRFKWAFEQHIYVEERVIFTKYHQQNPEDAMMIDTLVKQHHKLVELLDTVENDIVNKRRIFIAGFEDMWLVHNRFEDDIIYPKIIEKVCGPQDKVIYERYYGCVGVRI